MLTARGSGMLPPEAVRAEVLRTMLQESGTTATVAALVGWTVVVANVGDSLAFLDTGSEVVQVGPPAA